MAKVNIFEDISAAHDARQAIVSTSGDPIFARQISAGAGALQILGHVSDTSFQLLLQKRDEISQGQSSIDDPRMRESTVDLSKYDSIVKRES